MALILKIKEKINNTQAPYILKHDPIESRQGSIYLWDAGLAPLENTNTNTLATNLLGTFPEAEGVNLYISRGNGSLQNKLVKTEITSKGGFHVITSQAASQEESFSNAWAALVSNQQMRDKLYNIFSTGTPNLYVSVWLTTTRHVEKQTSLGPVLTYVQGSTNSLGFYIGTGHTGIGIAGASPYLTASKLNKNFKTESIVGVPNYYLSAVDRIGGSGVLNSTILYLGTGGVPPFSGTSTANQAWNGCPSVIYYRFYMEDLNKSGRTYEEVKSIDIEEYNKAFSEGGRFYNDSWSNPATVLP